MAGEKRAHQRERAYPTGLKVTDDELAALRLVQASFHGEWNYTLNPHEG
ncbi:ISAzo13-like element transposase-related protein [Ktedonobacter robiniae]|uniref:ISAzo13 family transposase n=1 Tax=Ktedonobacter robiniae TaxID=2778365 RepID=A0ABQ3UU23_9CHLR|nr:hypothetical protein KSB_48140 [Ktedonobacter robiniae]